MFLSAIVLALIVGTLMGGGLPRLAELRLRWFWLLGVALALRLLAPLLWQGRASAELPVGIGFIVAYLLILVWLAGNWKVPGLQLATVGVGLNTIAVFLNAGRMPIWAGAFAAAGFDPATLAGDHFHVLLPAATAAQFVATGGIFGDVIPIPLPFLRDVVSVGDILLAMGIFWTIVYSMTRPQRGSLPAFNLGPTALRPSAPADFRTNLSFGAGTAALPAPGGFVPSLPQPREAGAEVEAPRAPRGQSPYLTLLRNRNFSLLWTGQLISFMGDRIHQIALGSLLVMRGTEVDIGITFAATALPNVLLGPLAGALVDRWDRRWTMIVSDVVRSGLVLLVPIAIEINVALVYLIAFAVATVSLLFRPAKNALIPQIVGEDELVTANSASTVNETIADLLGYPIAGVVVGALGTLISAAFLLDAVTYLVSATLLWSIIVGHPESGEAAVAPASIWREMVEGWRFLVRQRELFTNTLVSTVAQVAVATEIVGSLIYAEKVLDHSWIPFPQNYALLMASLGLGSVVAGLLIGQLPKRWNKGPLAIVGFVGMGLSLAAAGFTDQPVPALVAFFSIGAFNVVWLVPTITLFQERTPQRLMGRVISTRQALVFGVMALCMGLAGWAAQVIGPSLVMIAGGGIGAAAGLVGAFLPAMRNAR